MGRNRRGRPKLKKHKEAARQRRAKAPTQLSKHFVPPAQTSPAGLLPAEIIDRIMSYRFANEVAEEDKNGRELRLVCRSWLKSTNRYLFQEVTLCQVEHVQGMERFYTFSANLVTTLRVHVHDVPRISHGQRNAWTISQLNVVLANLPNLTSLSVELNFNSPWHGNCQGLRVLPNLNKLSIISSIYEPNLHSCHDLILATPNIASLTLETSGSPYVNGSIKRKRPLLSPFHLSSLSTLHLLGARVSALFIPSGLLSPKTLAQITELALVPVSRPIRWNGRSYSAIQSLRMFGRNLKTLSLPQASGNEVDITAITSCRYIDTLLLTQPFHPLFLQPSIKVLKIRKKQEEDGLWPQGSWWDAIPPQSDGGWMNLERLELEGFTVPEYFKTKVDESGVELRIDGIKYNPESPELSDSSDDPSSSSEEDESESDSQSDDSTSESDSNDESSQSEEDTDSPADSSASDSD